MGIIKLNNYTHYDMHISRMNGAMGHPARKKIVEHLLTTGSLSNSDLPALLNLSQPAVSHHLNIMLRANLIRYIYHIHYHEIVLVPETFKEMMDYLCEINSELGNT